MMVSFIYLSIYLFNFTGFLIQEWEEYLCTVYTCLVDFSRIMEILYGVQILTLSV